MDGGRLGALDRVASRKSIDSCARLTDVFGRRNDLADRAFVHRVLRLISIHAGRGDAKAGI